MIGKLTQRFLREQDGIALVMAIAMMSILAITTTGVIVAGTAGEGTAYASMKARSAFAVAQQALAYGEGMVYGDVANGTTPPTTTQSLPTQPNGATGTYIVSTSNNTTWHVVATGTVSGITRTVSADVTPTQSTSTASFALWNYIYVDSTSTCSTFGGNATVSWPVLTRGDLCLQGTSTSFLNTVEVGGNLSFTGNPKIGSSSSPIPKLVVVGTCLGDPAGALLGASTSNCLYGHNSVYYSAAGHVLDTAAVMPTVNFQSAYTAQAALTKSGCPAGLFDNDSTMNNSVSAVDTVMFGSTYDCFVGTNEIKYNTGTHALFVHGTLYFDGSLDYKSSNITYTGQASMYFSDNVSFKSTQFCGIASCTTSWNTGSNLIVMVAGCQGGANGCVNIQAGATVQIAFYVNGQYTSQGGGSNMGPVMCLTIDLQGGGAINIPLTTFPAGTPSSSTTTTVTGTPPTSWSG